MNNAEYYLGLLKKHRRHLHQNPELAHMEFATSEYIKTNLAELGYSPYNVFENGVVCFADFGCERAIAFRADIDALPIKEKNEVEYASQNPGVMHACGHDGHTALVLVLAEYLKKEDIKPKRNVLFVFQPAEETDGGAEKMIAEGILEKYNVTEVLGIHVSADYKSGEFASTKGEFFAGGCELYFDVNGVSAHAAKPDEGINAVYASCELVRLIKSRICENPKYEKSAILSLCTLNSGTKCNIIPSEAKISGIMRAFNPQIFEEILSDILGICREVEKTTSAKVTFTPVRTYIPLINNPDLFDFVKRAADGNLKEASKTFLTDDFAYFAKARPALYILVGICDQKHSSPIHSDTFDFDEKSLLYALDLYLNVLKSFD